MRSALVAVDEPAIERAKTGDLDALERVYRAYESTVYALARRICRSAEDAEDVLQETFFEVCRSIESLRGTGPASLTAWIKRIAASKALMKVRREKYRETERIDDNVNATGRVDRDPGLRMDLEMALDRLTETACAVVWLHDVEGYTHEDIAEMTGKTVSFSKSQLARAHKKLRMLLDGEATC
ncbi:MAG: RNA polymerase sigma factor [Gemmatimonadales bacterium]